MGVITYEIEDASAIPAPRLFKAVVLESDRLLPKIIPDVLKSIEVLEGDGGPGTIKKLTYVQDGKVTCMKQKIEEIDKVNLKSIYSIIEGDILTDKLEKITYEFQFVPARNGGSIYKTHSKIYTKADFEIPEAQLKAGRESSRANLKAIEEYLLANPNVCK